MALSSIRLFINCLKITKDAPLVVTKDQHHYLSKVMRAKLSDVVKIFNGHDGEWEAEITSITKNEIALQPIRQVRPQVVEQKLTLVFAPIKAVTSSWIVQKATELGVTDIIPVITERSIVNKTNIAKLESAAIEAAEQCERLSVPNIHQETPLPKLLLHLKIKGNLIFCDERASSSSLIKCVYPKFSPSDNAILVGPEGGFSEKEKKFLIDHKHVIPVSLGKRILRAETAAISALSIYQSYMES